MAFEILEWREADAGTFVEFWSQHYSYDLEKLYEENIDQPLTEERVWDLFGWKNGTKQIAGQKQQSIRTNYLPEIGRTPPLNTVDEGRGYLARLHGGPIWDIFWLHCLRPAMFPIFDQHTYRAMARVKGLTPAELPASREQIITIYFEQFIPFFQGVGDLDQRVRDKALFAYGRFLKWGFEGK